MGCYERTLALLIEKYAGAFPLWLAPTQATVLPISNLFEDYAKEVADKLKAAGLRIELDNRNEKIGYRIREAQLAKTPYMVVVGANEQETGTVTIRKRGSADSETMTLDEFISKALLEIAEKRR